MEVEFPTVHFTEKRTENNVLNWGGVVRSQVHTARMIRGLLRTEGHMTWLIQLSQQTDRQANNVILVIYYLAFRAF